LLVPAAALALPGKGAGFYLMVADDSGDKFCQKVRELLSNMLYFRK
jgi:hypothetical protein